MTDFRFRAATVLDLRRTQEQEAAAARRAADARFQHAIQALSVATRDFADAQARLAALEVTGSDGASLDWHRNWIVRLAAGLERLRAHADDMATALGEADLAWQTARRHCRTLERMRDRAWQRFQHLELRQDQKLMDEVARVRHVRSDVWRSET